MGSFFFKLFFSFLLAASGELHPLYISVTTIEHNSQEKTLEVSCKIFTDDFEKQLRVVNKVKIDLLNSDLYKGMCPVVERYIQQHLQLAVNGKKVSLRFLGFEQEEEGIVSYFEAADVSSVRELEITNAILYEYKAEQMGIVHVIVNGSRQSTKLNNPETKAHFRF